MDSALDTRPVVSPLDGAAGLADPGPWLTAEQFACWPGDGTGRLYQLIDGEPVPMVHPSQVHCFIQLELGALIRAHLKAIGSPCRVLTGAGVRPRVGAAVNARVPDLVVTCGPLTEHYVPEPVVTIEILSPSNQAETRESVRACLSIPSLREVVVVSSVRVAAEVSRRGADGAWPADPTPVEPDADLAIEAIGFRCALRQIYPAD